MEDLQQKAIDRAVAFDEALQKYAKANGITVVVAIEKWETDDAAFKEQIEADLEKILINRKV